MIQFDYPSGGIGKKERKRYTFSDFRGVDTSVAEINVAPNHAVESTNFVDRDGVLHKRYGWEQVYQFDGAINGFWKISLNGVIYEICYAGKTFYRQTENGWETLYTSDKLVSRRTYCHVQNDKAYFIGCGDFLVFRFDVDNGKYAMFRVYDDTETYIPTTTAQISPVEKVLQGIGRQYVRDNINYMTGWRKNTLVGSAITEEGKLLYKLDSAISVNIEKLPKMEIGNKSYEFSYSENEEITVVEGVDLTGCSFVANGSGITWNNENIPWLSTDNELKEGEYDKDFVFEIKGDDGRKSGLRWKRESDSVFDKKIDKPRYKYKAYTLYLCNEDNTIQKPILRDFHRIKGSYTEELNGNEYNVKLQSATDNTINITVEKIYDSDINKEFRIDMRVSAFDENGNGSIFNVYDFIVPSGEMSHSENYSTIAKGAIVNKSYEITRAKKISYHNEIRVPLSTVDTLYNVNLSPIEKYTDSFATFCTSDNPTLKRFSDGIDEVIKIKSSAFILNDDLFDLSLSVPGVLEVKKWGVEGGQRVAVNFYVENESASESISSSKYATLYGIYHEANRLFLAGGQGKSNANVIFFSEMDDFTYFPDNFTKTVGGDENEVKGFIRLANGSMAALKTFNANEPNVYVFDGEYITGYYDEEQTEPYTLPRFSTSGVSITQAIVAPYACARLADDSMYLSQNGVYALELSQGTDSQRFAKERSLPINKLLKECNASDIENACAITYDNKYYLAVAHYKKTLDTAIEQGKTYYERVENNYVIAENPNADTGMSKYYEKENCVYIADARYSFRPLGSMVDTFSYEWYPLSNMPVYTWLIIDAELCFGTTDGRVCKVAKNSYYDILKEYYAFNNTGAEVKKYSQSLPKSIVNVLDTNEDGNIDMFTVAESADIDDDDTIMFIGGELRGIVYDEAKDLIGKELYIVKVKNEQGEFEGHIQLKYAKQDDSIIEFIVANNLVAVIQHKTIVKASRTTPTFDFGMPDYLKSLESFTVTMNGVDGGYAKLDISTRNNRVVKQNVQGQSYYDTLNGFSNTSFNVPFQNSYTQKALLRNFNYAIFKIENDIPVDCSVASISVMYKYNRASGGIK